MEIASILETIMLVCFGLSWPLNVVKAYRARTAKGMSLPFILLIISGYIIAWVLGFIVPGAPGGIGVRELVITLLLGSVVGESMVVTLSVTHRLITIIGDFMAYLVRFLIQPKVKNTEADSAK